MNWLHPRNREDRTGLYRLADNFLGIDDGVDTPGERLGQGVNALAMSLYNQPVETISNALNATRSDLNNLMFEGGAMQRPESVLGYAAAPMAPGAAGLMKNTPNVTNAITAYHGSPHSFDKFSMDAIGTGEGAQAYGHGLYFAENEGVARGYRDALADSTWQVDGGAFDANNLDHLAASHLADYPSPQRAVADLRAQAAEAKKVNSEGSQGLARRYERIASRIEEGSLPQFKENSHGSMYEVNINANPDEFLDWDQPMSKQPAKVREALGSVAEPSDWADGLDKWGGKIVQRKTSDGQVATITDAGGYYDVRVTPPNGDYYDASRRSLEEAKAFADKYQSQDSRNASSFFRGKEDDLRKAGVPGVKYFDEGSRSGRDGDGTRNYVVFDENLINIVRKYGIAGAATALGVSASDVQAAMAQGQQQ